MRHVISHPTCICVCAWIHVKITGHNIFGVSIVGPPLPTSLSPTLCTYAANFSGHEMFCYTVFVIICQRVFRRVRLSKVIRKHRRPKILLRFSLLRNNKDRLRHT